MSGNRPTKRERKDEARRERERIARDRQRRDRNRKLIAVVGVVAAVAVVTLVVLASRGEEEPAATGPPGVQDYAVTSQSHVDGPVQYPQDPPVGGDHNPVLLNCAAYDQPVPNENAVHDLEHGAVWITYQPDLAPDQVNVLRDLANSSNYILVSPYPGLNSPLAASSWGHQLLLPDANDPRLMEFIESYLQGPDTPEPGAPCSGGLTPGAG